MRRLSLVQSLSSLIFPSPTSRSGDSPISDDDNAKILDSAHNALALRFVIEEFVRTERAYIEDLHAIVVNYISKFESEKFNKLIPIALLGRSDDVFGNITELIALHLDLSLTSVTVGEDTVVQIAEKLIHAKAKLLQIYLTFISNADSSSIHRKQLGRFLKLCQMQASHDLSLESFLLKPVQRLTKYQLLLEELLRNCRASQSQILRSAVSAVRDVLTEINVSMHASRIQGFAGNLREFKRLCLQAECTVRVFDAKSCRIRKVHRRRTLLLFERGIMFCKEKIRKEKSTELYLEHKRDILIVYMGFEECSVLSPDSFDVWDVRRSLKYSVEVEDDVARRNLLRKLSESTVLRSNACSLKRDISADAMSPRIPDYSVKMRKARWLSESAIERAL